MIPTERELYINLMHILLVHFALVPIDGVAHIDGVDDIIQHMHKVTQHDHEKKPCKCCD